MRSANVILESIGDHPLTELMELDEFYGWSSRIYVLKSVFRKKSAIWPYILITIAMVGGLALVGAYVLIEYVI